MLNKSGPHIDVQSLAKGARSSPRALGAKINSRRDRVMPL